MTPKKKRASVPRRPAQHRSGTQRRTRFAFVVEPDAEARRTVADMVRAAGYEVVELHDGKEAWDALWKDRLPDVIVTLDGMKGIAGMPLADELDHALEARAPAVIVVAEPSTAGGPKGVVRGVVHKPVTARKLIDAIERALEEGPDL